MSVYKRPTTTTVDPAFGRMAARSKSKSSIPSAATRAGPGKSSCGRTGGSGSASSRNLGAGTKKRTTGEPDGLSDGFEANANALESILTNTGLEENGDLAAAAKPQKSKSGLEALRKKRTSMYSGAGAKRLGMGRKSIYNRDPAHVATAQSLSTGGFEADTAALDSIMAGRGVDEITSHAMRKSIHYGALRVSKKKLGGAVGEGAGGGSGGGGRLGASTPRRQTLAGSRAPASFATPGLFDRTLPFESPYLIKTKPRQFGLLLPTAGTLPTPLSSRKQMHAWKDQQHQQHQQWEGESEACAPPPQPAPFDDVGAEQTGPGSDGTAMAEALEQLRREELKLEAELERELLAETAAVQQLEAATFAGDCGDEADFNDDANFNFVLPATEKAAEAAGGPMSETGRRLTLANFAAIAPLDDDFGSSGSNSDGDGGNFAQSVELDIVCQPTDELEQIRREELELEAELEQELLAEAAAMEQLERQPVTTVAIKVVPAATGWRPGAGGAFRRLRPSPAPLEPEQNVARLHEPQQMWADEEIDDAELVAIGDGCDELADAAAGEGGIASANSGGSGGGRQLDNPIFVGMNVLVPLLYEIKPIRPAELGSSDGRLVDVAVEPFNIDGEAGANATGVARPQRFNPPSQSTAPARAAALLSAVAPPLVPAANAAATAGGGAFAAFKRLVSPATAAPTPATAPAPAPAPHSSADAFVQQEAVDHLAQLQKQIASMMSKLSIPASTA
jgi:hypothetical protein